MKDYDPHVLDLLSHVKDGSRVLDLGVADGLYAILLAKRNCIVTGVDIDEYDFAALNKQAQEQNVSVETVHADMTEYEPQGMYDAVVSTSALHFLDAAQTYELVKKMQAHTSDGGVHVFYTGAPHKESSTQPGTAEHLPWKDWYKDWDIAVFGEVDDPGESKFGTSDTWLTNHATTLVAYKRPKPRS